MIAGAILIFAGIVLFWASTRRTLTPTARGFLEGQGTLAVPAGIAAIAYGAGKEVRQTHRRRTHAKAVKPEDKP